MMSLKRQVLEIVAKVPLLRGETTTLTDTSTCMLPTGGATLSALQNRPLPWRVTGSTTTWATAPSQMSSACLVTSCKELPSR